MFIIAIFIIIKILQTFLYLTKRKMPKKIMLYTHNAYFNVDTLKVYSTIWKILSSSIRNC